MGMGTGIIINQSISFLFDPKFSRYRYSSHVVVNRTARLKKALTAALNNAPTVYIYIQILQLQKQM